MSQPGERLLAPALLCLSAFAGCSGATAQISKATPQEVASRAMESMDRNTDGKLEPAELADSPGLQSATGTMDNDRDGALTAEEITRRFQAYDTMADVYGSAVRVKLKGRPLAEATVTFSPEPIMGAGLQSYIGVTNERGAVLPKGEQVNLGGIPRGLYTVRIQHEGQGIDETHGIEIADDVPSSREMTFSL